MFWQSLLPLDWHTYFIPILGIAASLLALWIGKVLDRRKRGPTGPCLSDRYRLIRLSRSQERRLKVRVEGTLK